MIFNVIERLGRRLFVDEGAVVLEKKQRSAFYERNLAFMGLAAAASGKALKHLA